MRRVRPAESAADRRAVIAVAHAANGVTEPLGTYTARRLKSPLRRRAGWWLLELDGRAVSSLLCYPLRFADGERVLSGYGFGSVATLPDQRGQGHATALVGEVARHAEAEDRPLGLLFSAIDPGFYERLGFRVLPAWSWRHADPASVAGSGARAELTPIDPRESLALLQRSYRRGHPGLHLLRDEAAWLSSLRIDPDSLFFSLGDRGYLRVVCDRESLEILELFCEDPDPVIRAAAALAAELGLGRIETWLPPTPLLTECFEPVSRARTLPMLRGEAPGDQARFWGSDYF